MRYRILLVGIGIGLIAGCVAALQSLDLRVDTIPASADFGNVSPRVSPDKCGYYTTDHAPDASTYTVLARYIVQEEPEVFVPYNANEMIAYVCKQAVEKGADAIIVDDVGTTTFAGRHARTSPVVKARAIRFNGEPPSK